jgi:hypothetical protein
MSNKPGLPKDERIALLLQEIAFDADPAYKVVGTWEQDVKFYARLIGRIQRG